jgi:flagellar assembly protein FliH
MGMAQRFLFNVSFDEPDPPEPEDVQGAPPEPRFTPAELDAARAQGLEEGRKIAAVEAAQSAEAQLARAAQSLVDIGGALLRDRAELETGVERKAMTLLRAVLLKAVPALMAKDPQAELEAFVVRTLGECFDEPRIVLRVPDALFEALRERLAALSQGAGYSGKLVLLADPNLAAGDGRIEWADGGAERDVVRLLAELDALLSTPSPIPSPDPAEENSHE